jgi:hypothetical protein
MREDVLRIRLSQINIEYEAPFSLPCFAVTRNVFVTACFVRKYSCCEPGCEGLRHLVADIAEGRFEKENKQDAEIRSYK